jgi:hypothetical protein
MPRTPHADINPETDLTDAGTFQLMAAIFELDGWRLRSVPAGDRVSVTLYRTGTDTFAVPRFADGATAGAAAVAAYRRYRSMLRATAA